MADVSCIAVVVVPIGMMSGQSEKQSTRIRYQRPAYKPKSPASSWNGQAGSGFVIRMGG